MKTISIETLPSFQRKNIRLCIQRVYSEKCRRGVRPGFSQPYPWLQRLRAKIIPLPTENGSKSYLWQHEMSHSIKFCWNDTLGYGASAKIRPLETEICPNKPLATEIEHKMWPLRVTPKASHCVKCREVHIACMKYMHGVQTSERNIYFSCLWETYGLTGTAVLVCVSFMQMLFLDSNKIQKMDSRALRGLQNLTVLDVSKNLLKEAPSLMFIGRTLLRLNLDMNYVSRIQPNYFAHCGNLEVISVSFNKLTWIP